MVASKCGGTGETACWTWPVGARDTLVFQPCCHTDLEDKVMNGGNGVADRYFPRQKDA